MKKFDPKVLDSIKEEIKNNPPINPENALMMEKTKDRPALRDLVQKLNSNGPVDNKIKELNEKVINYQSKSVPSTSMNNFDDYEGIKLNENFEDEYSNFDYPDDKFEQAQRELMMKKNQKPVNPENFITNGQFQQPNQQRPKQVIHETYQKPMNGGYNKNDLRDNLLELFSKDYIIRVLKEYINTDKAFETEIINIVKRNFKKKGEN